MRKQVKTHVIHCPSAGEAHMKALEWFRTDPAVQILFIVKDNRPDELAWYLTNSPGEIRRFETCEEVLRPMEDITVSNAKPLIEAICKREGLSWSHDAARIIKLVNNAIRETSYIAQHMITRSGDNSEYLPNLIHYYTPRYIANCIYKN